jgi:pentatricopeptide repeat protein
MNIHQFANDVRTACLLAATTAYEDAGIQGLCQEGRWEAAVSAMQMIDLRGLAQRYERDDSGPA